MEATYALKLGTHHLIWHESRKDIKDISSFVISTAEIKTDQLPSVYEHVLISKTAIIINNPNNRNTWER
jgi:hypothetical protein